VVNTICTLVDELRPDPAIGPRSRLIEFVPDRPGHDRRYAIDASKIVRELGWQPSVQFDQGLRQTIEWYLGHSEWIDHVRTGAYRDWIRQNYDERIAQ
jgi:dTDP-glucose 4,6-dehydratase